MEKERKMCVRALTETNSDKKGQRKHVRIEDKKR